MAVEGVENTEVEIPLPDLPGWWLRIDSGIVALTKAAVFAIGASFILMISLEVASRFVLNTSVSQTNAVARLLLVWFFMMGAGLALRQGGHVGLQVLVKMLPPVLSGIAFMVAQMLVLAFLALMIWSGYLAFMASRTAVEGSLGISLGWAMAAFPTGFGLLIYHQAVMICGAIRLTTRKTATC